MIRIKKEGGSIFGIIPSNFIMNSSLSSEMLIYYVIIRTLFYNSILECSMFNIQTLFYFIPNEKNIKLIKLNFESLIENKMIILKDFYNQSYQIDYKSNVMFKVFFYTEERSFVKIPNYNLLKVLKYVKDNPIKKKYEFIRYYLIIARCCSNDSRVGYLSFEKVSQLLPVSRNTFSEWNNILQDLKIIYFNNDYGYMDKNGKIKFYSTIYYHRDNDNIKQDYKKELVKFVNNKKLILLNKKGE